MASNRFESRLEYLFRRAKRQTQAEVQNVISEASKANSLGSSRLGIEIVKVIENQAVAAVDDALQSFDRIANPFGRRERLNTLRQKITTYLHNDVRDVGRASLAFQNGRDNVMDSAIYEAEADLLSLIDQFELDLTSHRPAAFVERNKTAVQMLNWLLTISAFALAVASYLHKT